MITMSSPKKVKIINGIAVKNNVSEEEARGISVVYPNNTGLLLQRPEKMNNGRYKIKMRKMTALSNLKKSDIEKLEFTQRSKNMLENQLNRLHKSGRTHSDLKALSDNPKLINRINGFKRQILVNIENNKVKQMFLSDFDVRNTNDTKEDEKKILGDFLRYLNQISIDKRNRNSDNSNNNMTPLRFRRRLSDIIFQSPVTKSLF